MPVYGADKNNILGPIPDASKSVNFARDGQRKKTVKTTKKAAKGTSKSAPSRPPGLDIAPKGVRATADGNFNEFEDVLDKNQFPLTITSGMDGRVEGEFHINHLKNCFRDLARPNMFKVDIYPPPQLAADWNNKLMALVKTAVFPSIEIQDYEFERAGMTLHIPTNKMMFGELSVTFYNDVDFVLRNMFHKWQRLAVYNWGGSVGSIPLLALYSHLQIWQYDADLNPTHCMRLENVWPKSISEVSLSQDNIDQVEEFSVAFAYTSIEILSP